jgi:hypothetical protein
MPGIVLFVLASVWSGFGSHLAAAGEFEDAQANMIRSYNDFSRAARQNPHQDPNALSERTIGAAAGRLNQAMADTQKNTLTHVPSSSRVKLRKLSAPPGTDLSKVGKGNAAPSARPVGQNGPAYEHPKTVLDGKNIPREIDFSAPKSQDSAADSAAGH